MFEDFTVVDAPFWTLHPAGCDDVLISKIHILNDLDVANSDGIDPDHCNNVRILRLPRRVQPTTASALKLQKAIPNTDRAKTY